MKKIDLILLVSVLLLTFFGLFMIYDASSFVAFRDFADKYHYVKDQIFWIILGVIALFFFSRFDYRRLYNLAIPILLVAIGLLLAVFIPGVGVKVLGASRWINLRFTVLQPSEFVKIALAIYLAAWFSKKEKGRIWSFLLLLSMIIVLVILEPDMGTAVIILAEGIILYFLSGARTLYFFILTPVIAVLGFLFAKLEPYRAARITSYLNFNQGISSSSYHIRQILIALGSGGLTGVGLGNSLQKYAYLPENATDSIFAIIAEELGFLGAFLIIAVFVIIVWRGFYIAINARDQFGKLLAGGIITFLAMQIIINLSAQTALLPLTGIPLPFISYGGSALIINLTAIGILLNIARQGEKT
ncbi:MAG TPA: putative lipid II flippase FtsW [Patescibacteria group bacterium]|jgi:cell division protein FtsW|nr:putative lipid II flippase FtsW [Patescibacteria group bacterium]